MHGEGSHAGAWERELFKRFIMLPDKVFFGIDRMAEDRLYIFFTGASILMVS